MKKTRITIRRADGALMSVEINVSCESGTASKPQDAEWLAPMLAGHITHTLVHSILKGATPQGFEVIE